MRFHGVGPTRQINASAESTRAVRVWRCISCKFAQDVVFVVDAGVKSRRCGGLETQITALGRSHWRPKFPFPIPAFIYMSLNTASHYPLCYIWQIPALPMFYLALAIAIGTAPALCVPFCQFSTPRNIDR